MRIGSSVRWGESAFQAVAQWICGASPSAHPVGVDDDANTVFEDNLLALLAGCLRRRLAVGALANTGGVAPVLVVHKTAIATWFGPGFYGQTTACGQILTPEIVGVANRTLPCGTLVKVSYRGHA